MEEFCIYLDQQIELLAKEESELKATERKDEANLVKVRSNIYGVCKTIYEVLKKSNEGPTLKDVYYKRLDNLRQTWTKSYELAKEHNDIEQTVIGEIKLETLKDCWKHFEKGWVKIYG